jgi:hypothetical protein
MRDLEQYEIVGELPCVDDQEPLFYPEVACNKFSRLIKNYINTNFAQVRAKCISVGLVPTISQEVWSPCRDCDAQFHQSCYKQCYQNTLRFCCAAYCPGAIDRSSTCVGNWTDNRYKQNLKRPPVVASDKIKDDNCPVCFESLLPKAITIGLAAAATERPELQMTTRSGRSYAQGLAATQEALEINSVASSTTLKRKRSNRGAGAPENL